MNFSRVLRVFLILSLTYALPGYSQYRYKASDYADRKLLRTKTEELQRISNLALRNPQLKVTALSPMVLLAEGNSPELNQLVAPCSIDLTIKLSQRKSSDLSLAAPAEKKNFDISLKWSMRKASLNHLSLQKVWEYAYAAFLRQKVVLLIVDNHAEEEFATFLLTHWLLKYSELDNFQNNSMSILATNHAIAWYQDPELHRSTTYFGFASEFPFMPIVHPLFLPHCESIKQWFYGNYGATSCLSYLSDCESETFTTDEEVDEEDNQ